MANWSELSIDVLEEVAKQLPREIDEFVRFSAVCKQWRSSLIKVPFAPWLMLAKEENDHGKQGIRSFYIVSKKNRVFNLELPTQGRRCWGTSYGWLFTLGLDLKINIFNPLSRVQISLPSQTTFVCQPPSYKNWPSGICRYFIKRVAMKSTPLMSTVVMTICGECSFLAYACPGDKIWRLIDGASNLEDIIFYNGYFYVVSVEGFISVCDIGTTPPSVTIIASPPEGVRRYNTFYLVELYGELHFVERVSVSKFDSDSSDESESEDSGNDESDNDSDDRCQNSDGDNDPAEEEKMFVRFRTGHHYDTKGFHVFKFNSRREWNNVDDLGEYALFLGNNTSFAISTLEYPHFKGNCIYFTDDHQITYYNNGFCDMGVYDFSNDTISTIYSSNDEFSKISRPVFFMPVHL